MRGFSISRNYYQLSKFLSLVLRHKPEILDLDLNEYGFTSITLTQLAYRIREKGRGLGWVEKEDILEVVEEDKKGRYEVVDNKIRARYGHSIDVNLLEAEDYSEEIPDTLYHGTSAQAADKILEEGLKSQNRVYVHLSEDPATAESVGKRHCRSPVILKINAEQMVEDDYILKKAGKTVYIAKGIPPEYIDKLDS